MINELRQVTVHEIGDLKEGTNEKTGKDWKLRSVVVEEQREYNDKVYTDFLDVTCFNQAADGLADVNVGDTVDIGYTASSRKRTSAAGKEYWGTSAKCISLKVVGEVGAKAPEASEGKTNDMSWAEPTKPQENDPLPF